MCSPGTAGAESCVLHWLFLIMLMRAAVLNKLPGWAAGAAALGTGCPQFSASTSLSSTPYSGAETHGQTAGSQYLYLCTAPTAFLCALVACSQVCDGTADAAWVVREDLQATTSCCRHFSLLSALPSAACTLPLHQVVSLCARAGSGCAARWYL